eukprot:CAMPEP_0169396158 /NCGR_PEP_ID=MMETSP1017-20121227/51145_1 /TAXON_ID=342587 /ORGANISM="Karlodinium micrum, Strain CCMP2283" /LENGTH=307 /DNA_ID=CAMNT_0009500431 /DNA_START=52 /DNA_END=975 /DNA_ORIENTATION=-
MVCDRILLFSLFSSLALGSAFGGNCDAASLLQVEHNTRNSILSSPASPTQSTGLPDVFVVIPGLGDERRVPYVRDNLRVLREELGHNFACSLNIYADGASTNAKFDQSLFRPCKVTYRKWQAFESIKHTDISGVEESGTILLLLDDIIMNRSTINTMRVLQLQHGHDVVSGAFDHSYCPLMWSRSKCNANEACRTYVRNALMLPESGRQAHPTTLVDFNVALFKRKSFACLQDIIDPVLNPIGFGYDNMYNGLCSAKMAVCDTCVVQHMSSGVALINPPTAVPPSLVECHLKAKKPKVGIAVGKHGV